jgi:CRISPR system Cascade subunit CasA
VSDSYDLLDRPWLLVRDVAGETVELSLVDVFRQADRVIGLVGDVPTQVFAMTRLMLAVLHGALRGTLDFDEWARMWRDRALPVDRIEGYLDAHRDRFDLFHPQTPFLQVAGLRTAKDEVSDLSKLVADVPNGHPFFSVRLDRNLTLSFAEAARWVVHCHAFDPSGIKSGAVGDERVKGGKGYPIGTGWSGYLGGVLPEGANLLETLLLNLIPPAPAVEDFAAWERPPVGPDGNERTPTGPVDLFTWQSRRIRLARVGDRVVGVLICNGDRATPQNMHTREAHTAWRRSEAQQKKLKSATPVYMPLEHNAERLVWRGLQAMLPGAGTRQGKDAAARLTPNVVEWISKLTNDRVVAKNYALRLRTIGMTYGNQSSTTTEIVDDAVALQAVLLDQGAEDLKQVVLSAVSAAENAATAVGKLAANLAEAGGSRDSVGHRTRAVESAYAELDPLFRAWLAALGPESDPMDGQIRWHSTAYTAIRVLGDGLVADVSPSAWVGRMVKGRWLSSTHADGWFRRDLFAALPLAEQLVRVGKET